MRSANSAQKTIRVPAPLPFASPFKALQLQAVFGIEFRNDSVALSACFVWVSQIR